MMVLLFGGVVSGLTAIERIMTGSLPGLSLIATGILLPVSLLSYYVDYQNMLVQFRSHILLNQALLIGKNFAVLFAYVGILSGLAYGSLLNFRFIGLWFLLITPGLSFVLTKFLKAYLK